MIELFRSALRASVVFAALFSAPVMAQEDSSTVRETHGDWEIRCVEESKCWMEQIFKEGEEPVMLMRVRKFEEPLVSQGKSYVAEAELFVRLGHYLPAGISLRIDEGDVTTIPYERCIVRGCFSLPLFTSDIINNLKNGGVANFTMVQSRQKLVQATISLSGFTNAFDGL